MEGTQSDELHIGDMSIVQGSTVSCLLYSLYTLDLPLLFQQHQLTVQEESESTETKATTYVDDTTVSTTMDKDNQKENQTKIDNKMIKLINYMNSNYLTINPTKTQLLILSKDINTREKHNITTETKTSKPTKNFKYLGINICENLKWNEHITTSKESLLKQLTRRITAINKLKKFLDKRTLTKIATGIFYSKLLYGMEVWGSTPKYLIDK